MSTVGMSLSETVMFGTGVFCVLLGLCIAIVAIQLCRGKWYRIIAGNNHADEKTIEEQRKQGLGLGVGICLFIAAFVVFVLAGFAFLHISL